MDLPQKNILSLILIASFVAIIFVLVLINFFFNREGKLIVDINPEASGAIVYTNSRMACYAPCVINLQTGHYTITIAKEAFHTYEAKALIKRGKTTIVNAKLILAGE